MPQTAGPARTLLSTDSTVVIQLEALEDPATDEGHSISYAVGKDRAGGRPMHADVSLLHGFRSLDDPGEELVRWRHEDLQPGLGSVTQAVPPGAAAKIVDYSDLQIRVDFTRG